jgi:hypothetical protein
MGASLAPHARGRRGRRRISEPSSNGSGMHKKRAASQWQRPKSREETPKEGGGNARDRVTALHQYAPASHKKQGVLT